jgi:hypothetical protein
MIKMDSLKGIIKVITAFTKTHSPEILVGLGIAGMTTSTVLAVRATPKAVSKINAAIDETNEKLMDIAVANHQDVYSPITKLKPLETVKLCWKGYVPAAVTGVASIVCIIGGTRINLRRNAALVTAVKISETTIRDLQTYKNKVVETIGEEKNNEIETKANEEIAQQAFVGVDTSIIPGKGSILCLEKMGGQWFKSDKEEIREVFNNLNYTMNDDMYVSLGDFYAEMGISNTVAGEALGWNRDQGLIEPKFTAGLLQNGTPILVVSTRLEPRTDYSKLM